MSPRKNNPFHRFSTDHLFPALLAGITVMVSLPSYALTWDANNTGAGQTDGAGGWLNANQWWNGAANVTWISGDAAVFGNGGAGGAVTLANPTTVGSITFNSFTGTYTLGTVGQALTINTDITKNAGSATATFVSPITLGGNVIIANNATGAGTDINLNASIGESVLGSGITKTGAGSLSIGNFAGTYTGTTTIENGTITASNATALGTSTTAIALGNATSISSNLSPTLQVNGNTTMARNVMVGASNGATSGIYTIGSGNGSSAAHLNGQITLNQNLSVTTTNGIYYLGDTGVGAITSGSLGTQTVTFSGGGSQYVGAAIGGGSGTIGVTKMNVGTGTATTFLTGANTYTGATTVNQGTLQLTGSLSSSSALVVGGGTFAYNPGTYANTAGLTGGNLATFTAASGSSQTVNGLTINSGLSSITASAGNTLNLGTVTRNAGGLINFGTTGTITTSSLGSNGILGAYAYTNTGANLRYVTAGGTIAAYTGGTAAPDATGVTDATGTANYDVAAGGAVGASASANTLRYTGAAGTITGPVTLNGLMNAGTGALTLDGAVTSGSTNELVVLSNGQSITLNGALGDNGANAVAVTYGGPSAGVLTLTAANTYTGSTVIRAGTVQLGNGGATGSLSSSGTIVNNGNLTINRNNAVVQGTAFSSAPITGTGSFTQAGTGTTTFTAANTYGGATTISAGSLQLGNGGAAGSIAATSNITNNGNLTINRNNAVTQGVDFGGGAIGGTGSFTHAGSGTTTFTANNTYSGVTVINAGTLTLTTGNNAGGALSGTPSITVNSGGKLVLMNQDTLGYTLGKEALIINSGGQVLNNSTGTQRNTLANTVTMTGGILGGTSAGDASGLYSFFAGAGNNAVSATSDASGTAALINASRVAIQGATQNFHVTPGVATPAADLMISSQIVQLGGNFGLNKTGNGIMVMTGASTYTGATTVSAGTLLVNGSLGNTAVAVNGGTFGGTGTVGGAVTVNNGGTLAPGASIETLASGALSFTTGSTLAYEMDSTAAAGVSGDLQIVSGNLSLDSAGANFVTLTLTDLAGMSATAFSPGTILSLINYSGVWDGGLFTVDGNELADGAIFNSGVNTWQIDYNADSASGGVNFPGEHIGGGSFVNLTAVPETSAALLGGLGSLLLLRRRRAK